MTKGNSLRTNSRPRQIVRNSLQVNVIAIVDVARAVYTETLDDAVIFVDNSVTPEGKPSPGRGTTALKTQCLEGMVINWIVYPVGPYGVPVPVSIADITFDEPICVKLQSYGSIVTAHSPDVIPGVTPSYDYWAGMVRPEVEPNTYGYRIEFQIGTQRMGISTPAVEISTIPAPLQASGDRGKAQYVLG
ncbi:hypothetical protein CCR90_14170 [Rhodovulum sulfidophilum]|uniref:hypothetical protein n=1 Tax=Rhodovulum sulfidophilum TaxID=35806 RepID=UPI001913367A|nr:hypothetical protein [Rhodovulum sulfidophilum]MBK5924889.1 hypothetical protein [Rhodovulum sulfidophilum]